jgi:hypothetical protein
MRRPFRAALDAVTASWTIGGEEDGPRRTWPVARQVGGLLWEPAADPADDEDDGDDGTAGVLVPA